HSCYGLSTLLQHKTEQDFFFGKEESQPKAYSRPFAASPHRCFSGRTKKIRANRASVASCRRPSCCSRARRYFQIQDCKINETGEKSNHRGRNTVHQGSVGQGG